MKLYGRVTSSNVMKVLWLLDELGLGYERIDAGLSYGALDATLNPFRLIPVLDDDGFVLFESNAILRYLARGHAAQTRVYPSEPRARAVIDAWMDVQQTEVVVAMGPLFVGLIRTLPEHRDPVAIERARAAAAAVWTVIDAQIARAGFVAGTVMTLADYALGPHVHRWFALPVERPELPALSAWYAAMRMRPAYIERVALPLT